MCCAQALQVSAIILATLSKAEVSPELLDLQFLRNSDQGIADSSPNTFTGSSISRVDGLQGFDENSGGMDPAMQVPPSFLAMDHRFASLVGKSQSLSGLQSSDSQAPPWSLTMDQRFASTAPQSQPLRSLQSSDEQEQVSAVSQLGSELKQTSQAAALLAQDAALLAKELVAMNSALRGVQGFNSHSPAQTSELQMAKDSAIARVQAMPHAVNLADMSPAAMSATENDGSSSSSGPRCGGKDQLACNSTNAYFTMNYRVPLWLGVILWVLIWVCIICFCVGLCINIFKPNVQ